MILLAAALVIAASGPPSREVRRYDGGRVGYTVVQTPGVAKPKHTFELAITLEELRKTPDPSFGKRRLLAGAELSVYLTDPKGAVIDARLGSRDGDDGKFAVSFTVPRDGIYSAHLVGKAPDGITIDHAVLVSVGVWPMLEGIVPDALPALLPPPAVGDVTHGKLLCARDCAKTPQRLSSEIAEGLADAELLALVAPNAAALRELDRNDLLAYVRGQFIRVRDLFPAAVAYVPERRTLDSEGIARLKEMAGLPASSAEGLVFVVYGGARPSGPPSRIEPADRLTKRALSAADRLGYLVYGTEGEMEVAIALGHAPGFAVLAARQRDAAGVMRNARPSAKSPLVRRAVELANAYDSEERDRAVIDEGLR
ncbi:MAG: hypothetical protein ACAI38_24570 [Myxococcota bacterium]